MPKKERPLSFSDLSQSARDFSSSILGSSPVEREGGNSQPRLIADASMNLAGSCRVPCVVAKIVVAFAVLAAIALSPATLLCLLVLGLLYLIAYLRP